MFDALAFSEHMPLLLGLDLGSTTAKLALLEGQTILYRRYERHRSKVRETTLSLLDDLKEQIGDRPFSVALSGSAGLGLSQQTNLPFVQEVYATGQAVNALAPEADAVVELGGEDAKVLFLKGGVDQRMNGSCAGGTGAFIDQMATLLGVTVEQLDALSLAHERIYPIASRCGVFAKSDIQPLLNQGARREDLAASIYQAVVNQTITGLAQGRAIEGRVLFLGGPLHYCKGLRQRFVETLHLSDDQALFPDYGRFAVAIGAALCAKDQPAQFTCQTLAQALHSACATNDSPRLPPLFESEQDYAAFCARHARACLTQAPENYEGNCSSPTTAQVAAIRSTWCAGNWSLSMHAADRASASAAAP